MRWLGRSCPTSLIRNTDAIARKNARADADRATDPRAKRIPLGVADSYDRLAERIEQRLRDAEEKQDDARSAEKSQQSGQIGPMPAPRG
jgi:hypothetical protein